MQPARVNGPGTGTLTGHVGVFAEPAIFGHGAQAVGCGERFDRAIAVALIVRRGAPAAGSRQRLEPCEILVESQVEIDALHFAVGDPIEARTNLVVDRQANGVADGLVAIGRSEQLGLGLHVGDELFEPARERPASDHRGGDQVFRHRNDSSKRGGRLAHRTADGAFSIR